jgi:lysophospholipase L1-like esterase
MSNASDPPSIRYLALGDSYTIGESVSPQERYPVLLSVFLEKNGYQVQHSIVATTGWTTQNLEEGLANAGIEGKKYDLVSLLIGVNNQFQGRSEEEYKTQFTQLLLGAVEFANGNSKKVFVISIPDYGYTPYGRDKASQISPQIDLFNQVNKQVTDSLGILYVDITPLSRKGLSDPNLVASDGLHPSGLQYAQWVELMQQKVLPLVKAK